MAKNVGKVVSLVIVMELIMVAAITENKKVSIRPEFSPACAAKCAVECLGNMFCMATCLLGCFKPAANGMETTCTKSCTVSMCSQFQNPGDTEKLQGCIIDNCIPKCVSQN